MKYLYPFFVTKIYASGFFSDYPSIKFDPISSDTLQTANKTFNAWVYVLNAIYFILITISVLSLILSFGRLAFHADDNPFKKEGIKHDIIMAVIMLAILGTLPLFVGLVINLLNNRAI